MLELVPDVEVIHSWSDGPTSQYKNKRFLYLWRHFCKEIKLKKATHNYNGPGHGKGPWDAEGANLKNDCDRAVLRGKDVICAQDMIDVIKQNEKSKLKAFKVEKDDIKRIENIIPKKVPSVKKILSSFQVTWLESKSNTLHLKSLSCPTCTSNDIFCDHYKLQIMFTKIKK